MNIYPSKSSLEVKLITGGVIVTLLVSAISLFVRRDEYGLIAAIFLALILLVTVVYFYTRSLREIIVDDEVLLLKKNVGKIKISISEIKEIKNLEFSNLSWTSGSKGLFGFIGTTMDDSISFVKNRKKMVLIQIPNKKYIISADNSEQLVKDVMKHI